MRKWLDVAQVTSSREPLAGTWHVGTRSCDRGWEINRVLGLEAKDPAEIFITLVEKNRRFLLQPGSAVGRSSKNVLVKHWVSPEAGDLGMGGTCDLAETWECDT